jgi:hypothetical protein
VKKSSNHKEIHVSPTKVGSGDYYGTGIKNPIGRTRDSYVNMTGPSKSKRIGKMPKSLA